MGSVVSTLALIGRDLLQKRIVDLSSLGLVVLEI